jgi:hypothetical protein
MNRLNRNLSRSLAMALLMVLVMGCSSYPRRVDCDGRLTPINPPAPAAKATHR